MKKIILVSTLLFSFAFSKAQQSFLFHIKYLPGCLYESTITMGMNMEMNISGDSATMAGIKAKGIKLPMIATQQTIMDADIKTGAVKTDNTFPISIYYKDITAKKIINGTESKDAPNPIIGQTIFGQYSTYGKLQIDSMSGKNIDDQLKAALTTTISNMLNQMNFPENPMKIGDTFTQNVPFSMPLAGMNMEATIKIIYKLTSVEKNLAYFDLDESMDMDMSTERNSVNINMKATGAGNGKMIYDINDNYSPTHSTAMKMDYKMLMGKLTMTGSADISSNYQTKMSYLTK